MPRRRAIGAVVFAGRIVGLLLIILAILSLPPMKALLGEMASPISTIASLLLGIGGIACLIAIQIFLRFFDQFLSRN
jgi:hypothetical protein